MEIKNARMNSTPIIYPYKPTMADNARRNKRLTSIASFILGASKSRQARKGDDNDKRR